MSTAGARTALLERLIDHAALFPPASLPMEAALEVDRRARTSEEAWMLHRFLVPASKIDEVPEDFEPPIGLVLDLDSLSAAAAHRAEVVEAPLARADVAEVAGVRVFLEVPARDAAALDEVAWRGAGAKVRCGGATPDMFPSPDDLAAFVGGCRDRDLRFKATAGLHHPIRDGLAHGFLNLLAAAVMARAGAGVRELTEVLLQEDPAVFSVSDEGFEIAGQEFEAGQIAAARAGLFVGYGSCSFSEPVEDLHALGVL